MLGIIILIAVIAILAIVIRIAIRISETRAASYQKQNEERRKVEELSKLSDTGVPSCLMAKQSEKHLASTVFTIQKPDKEILMEYASTNSEFHADYSDLKMMYEAGNRIYEYEAHIREGITLEEDEGKTAVLVEGKRIGFINAAETERIRKVKAADLDKPFLDAYLGDYLKVSRNPDYEKDIDDPEDKLWIDSVDNDKVTAKLLFRYWEV